MFLKSELKETLELYCAGMKMASDVCLGELSEMCEDFTGADVKSVVCDALLKSFHRVKANIELTRPGEFEENEADLRGRIVIEMQDFVSSVQEIKKMLDKDERRKNTRMYENWSVNKSFRDPEAKQHQLSSFRAKATLAWILIHLNKLEFIDLINKNSIIEKNVY